MDLRGWITGDNESQSPLQNEDIKFMQSYTLLEITYIDFKPRRYIGAQICSYSLYCPWYGSSKYVTDHFSEHCSQIPNYAAYTAVPMPNSIPNQILSHSYNGDTTYLEAVSDKSSAVQ